MSLSSACTSSTDAIGIAWMQIKAGLIDRAIVGGTEAPLSPILFASFDRLGVMSREENPERSSRPFAADRDGFVMSEGAGVCILEADAAALERGARGVVEVSGYGATSDAYHPFSPLPGGAEGERAIRMALAHGQIALEEVDYVSAHAIGSKPNDPLELDILRKVFLGRKKPLAVSSMKSMIGHTMGASGILQLIGATQSIQASTIAPTINLGPADVPADLDLVPNLARLAKVSTAVLPTFGFGSRNAALAVSRHES